MNTSKVSNNFPISFRGFLFACEYLMSDGALVKGYALTSEELKAYTEFPHGRRENFASIIHRANKLRNEAHRKATVINRL